MNTSDAAIVIAPETLSITWVAFGALFVELLVLIVFLVRVSWWLSHRFTAIDAGLGALGQDVTQLKVDMSNDIAGRRVVAETRNDLVAMKTTLDSLRERVGRLEDHEDQRTRHPPTPEASG